jgi:regulator of replication initiation timing
MEKPNLEEKSIAEAMMVCSEMLDELVDSVINIHAAKLEDVTETMRERMWNAPYLSTGKEKEDPYVIERHAKDSMYPIYMEGFNASPDAENPYQFNRELSQQRSIIAMKRHLTDEDKKELKKLQEQLQDEPWDRWSQGHFVRSKYVYLK